MKVSLSFLLFVAVIQLGSSNVLSKRGTQEQLLSDAAAVQNGSNVIVAKPGPLDVILNGDELVFEVCSMKCTADFLVCYAPHPSDQSVLEDSCDTKYGFYEEPGSCDPPPTTTTLGQHDRTSSGKNGHVSATTDEPGSFFADYWWISLILGIILIAVGIGIGVGIYCYLRRKKKAQKPITGRRRKLLSSESPVLLQPSTETQKGKTESAVRPDPLFQQSSCLSHKSSLNSKKEEPEKEKSVSLSSVKQQLLDQQQHHLNNLIELHLVKMNMHLQQPMNLEASLLIIGGFFQSLVLSLSPLVLELASAVIFDVKRNLKSLYQHVDENFKGVNPLLFYSHQLKHNKDDFCSNHVIGKLAPLNGLFVQQAVPSQVNGESIDLFQSFLQDAMIMGFYMTHPSPGCSKDLPSVCGHTLRSAEQMANRGSKLWHSKNKQLGYSEGDKVYSRATTALNPQIPSRYWT